MCRMSPDREMFFSRPSLGYHLVGSVAHQVRGSSTPCLSPSVFTLSHFLSRRRRSLQACPPFCLAIILALLRPSGPPTRHLPHNVLCRLAPHGMLPS